MRVLPFVVLAGLTLTGSAFAGSFTTFSAFQAATSGLTDINFDTDTSHNAIGEGTQVGSIYSTLGVTFTGGNYAGACAGPTSSPNCWFNDTLSGSDRVFDAEFTGGNVTAVGTFNGLFSAPSGAILRAFDAGSNLLGSVSSDSDPNSLDFFGLTTSTPIAKITVTITSPTGWALDDLNFGNAGASTVPEPSTAMLGVTGLALLLARARARRAAATQR